MSTTPIRPAMKSEQIDPETERIIRERLATFDEDKKNAVDAREALTAFKKTLQHPLPR